MLYGIVVPHLDQFASARTLADLARDAETSGWDGFFIWDHVMMPWPTMAVDPWVALTAVALITERIRIGTLVTPLPRRRPWKLARETVSLDHLSNGRLILGVGLGAIPEEFDCFGEPADLKTRAEMLDEGLTILTGLWEGEPLNFHGKHFQVSNARLMPPPLQSPRIPIWTAGTWPIKAPFRRAARWDGVAPHGQRLGLTEMMSPRQVSEMVAYIRTHRAVNLPFDVVHFGITSGRNPVQDANIVTPYTEAGVTWWIENINPERWGTWNHWPFQAMHKRILDGPPKI